jgi:hemolysin activation/secretion protein
VIFLRPSIFAFAMTVASQSAFAQQPIGAGGIIQQIPQPPALEKSLPDIPTARQTAPLVPATDETKIFVGSIAVTGETLFPESTLIEVTGFRPGSELGLSDLRNMAARITDYYSSKGYFVSQAFLPAQDIKDGVVTIAVIEGRYDKITFRNQSPLSDRVLGDAFEGLNAGDPVATAPLERSLLLASDIPGVAVKSTMVPGAAVGTSDLVVDVVPGPSVTGSIEADNWGNPYTGADRVGGTVNLNDPLGIGDVLSARVLGSTSGGLQYGRLSYQALVDNATLGVAYTAFHYHLDKQFKPLNANGSEQIGSIYGSYPVIRSYDNNLYVQADFDYRTFQDNIGATASTTDKQAVVFSSGISGDHRDNFGGGGSDTYDLTATFGNLDIQSPISRAADAETARTNGQYAKLSGSVSRLQHLFGPVSLYGSVRGQVASKNLDISEKMELGGATGVRAYPEGEAYGDQGYLATLEARWLLPEWDGPIPGRVQLISFLDTGYVDSNQSPWLNGHNDVTRSGVGVGANWEDTNNFAVNVSYAVELGDARATSAPDHTGRLWVQLVKYF